ncbi:MAG: glycoside hydrolase family 25 protein [Lachnospiraceae bacterium]|nr:glycoside hydrolase family 25 protein [Lachnospiraceae bacterium]
MDSKLVRATLLAVTVFIAAVFGMVLLINGYGTGKKETVIVQEEEPVTEYTEEDGKVKGADLSAWMQDETFFDSKRYRTLEKMEQDERTLSLMTTSIEKDLRIRIVNSKGEAVKGHAFTVTVSDAGEYKDVDRDGVIYIGDMKPGDYSITLLPEEGFFVSEEPLLVKVKAQIEYCAIDDISYLIKTEDEIDAEAEDTAVNDAADGSAGTSQVKTMEGGVFGIDVSKWNQEIDWKAVKQEGVSFAIIRAGYRGSVSGSLVIDPYFEKNIKGALQNDIDVGVYFFTQAINEIEAVEEASMVLSLLTDYDITYPVFIDTEGAGGNGRADKLDTATRSKACQAFCETIRSGGLQAGVYASKNWLNQNIDITKLSGDDIIWLAEYKEQPTYGGTYQMWQYTSSGRINGIEGRVDFNISFLPVKDNKKENQDGQDNG